MPNAEAPGHWRAALCSRQHSIPQRETGTAAACEAAQKDKSADSLILGGIWYLDSIWVLKPKVWRTGAGWTCSDPAFHVRYARVFRRARSRRPSEKPDQNMLLRQDCRIEAASQHSYRRMWTRGHSMDRGPYARRVTTGYSPTAALHSRYEDRCCRSLPRNLRASCRLPESRHQRSLCRDSPL